MTAAEQAAMGAVPGIPIDANGPVFKEPWEAQAFAMTLALYDKGLFAWSEWAAMLGETIKAAQAAGDPDTGATYYSHWLATLERMVAVKSVSTPSDLATYRDAWEKAAARTPHGQPIDLQARDFAR
jgi:nitrile hydratase accessory protein